MRTAVAFHKATADAGIKANENGCSRKRNNSKFRGV